MTKANKSGGMEMTDHAADKSLQRTARVAGLAFLLVLIGYTLSWIFVYAKLIVPGNAVATAQNIMAHELLFRIGIAGDLMIAISAIVLAWALYILLKPVNKNLALLALFLKLTDAVLAIVAVSFSFIALRILPAESYSTVFEPEKVQALVGLFLNLHAAASTVPMVFTGLGFIVFFYLLFKSKYVPAILSGLGIFSYALILLSSCKNIIGAKSAAGQLSHMDMIFFAPSILFELIIGLWLLLKGVGVQQGE
jgi:hypothetical protein